MKTIASRVLPRYKLYIETPRGDRYYIHVNGDIQRLGMEHTPSGQWKFLGLSHVKKAYFIPFEKLTPKLVQSLILHWKNGNPQYTVRDLDHGTPREWGNTKYHGVKTLIIIKAEV